MEEASLFFRPFQLRRVTPILGPFRIIRRIRYVEDGIWKYTSIAWQDDKIIRRVERLNRPCLMWTDDTRIFRWVYSATVSLPFDDAFLIQILWQTNLQGGPFLGQWVMMRKSAVLLYGLSEEIDELLRDGLIGVLNSFQVDFDDCMLTICDEIINCALFFGNMPCNADSPVLPFVFRISSVEQHDQIITNEESGGNSIIEYSVNNNDAVSARQVTLERARFNNGEEDCKEPCAVCLDEFSNGAEIIRMPCRHFYHSGCIFKWLQRKNRCPLCRFKLPLIATV